MFSRYADYYPRYFGRVFAEMTRARKYFDVIVVGSGASGAVCSHFLTAHGLSVCCLERGDWSDPHEFPVNSHRWESLKKRNFSPDPNTRRAPSDYPINVNNSPVDIANFNGVGGATVLYSGHYPRFHPSDFRTYSCDGVGRDWPISYDDLLPHYTANEIEIGVSGLAGDPVYPDLMSHLNRPVPIGVAGRTLVDALNRMGWHWWPSYSAILQQKKDNRQACAYEGPCNTGCFNGAKGSADVTFMAKALEMGLELRTNCTVTNILIEGNRAVGVQYLDQLKNCKQIYGRKILLACNAIGTCRILWDKDKKEFIGNSSGLVGKNFMIHPLGYVEGLLSGDNDAFFGPQGSWIASHEFYETNLNRDFLRGYSMHFLRGTGPAENFYNSAIIDSQFLGKTNLVEHVRNAIKNKVSVAIICEDLPELSNTVEMSANTAEDGMPVPSINYRLSENTKKMMSHGMSKAKTLLAEAGATQIRSSGPVKMAGWHLTGTTVMGDDPATSVVSKWGEMHDVPQLHIVDGGIFPTSAGVNPAATIQAVARYISKRVAGELLANV